MTYAALRYLTEAATDKREILGSHCGIRLSRCYPGQPGESHIEPIARS